MPKPTTYVNFVLDCSYSMEAVKKDTMNGFNDYIRSLRESEERVRMTLTQFNTVTETVFEQREEDEMEWTYATSQPWVTCTTTSSTAPNIGNLTVEQSMPYKYVPRHKKVIRSIPRIVNKPIVDEVYRNIPIKDVEAINSSTYKPSGGTPLLDAVGHAIKTLSKDTARRTGAKPLIVVMTDGQENSSRDYTSSHIRDLVSEKEEQDWTFVFLGADQDAWSSAQHFGFKRGNTMTYDKGRTLEVMANLSNATMNYAGSNLRATASFFADAGQTAANYSSS